MAVFLSALELSCVGTALPTIVHDLKGGDFVWVGSAYALTSAAFMPTAGGLSNIFGRRAVMLSCIAFFTAGAALAGSAHSINSLIAARGARGVQPSSPPQTAQSLMFQLSKAPAEGASLR